MCLSLLVIEYFLICHTTEQPCSSQKQMKHHICNAKKKTFYSSLLNAKSVKKKKKSQKTSD